jgi:hypothetical protein
MLQLTASRSVLVSCTHLGPQTLLLLSDSFGYVVMRHPIWGEGRFVVYNCCWPSPALSFSGLGPQELMTVFYCLRFRTQPTWRTRSQYLFPPGTGWSGYTPRHWVPFPSPPTTRRATVEVLEPTSLRSPGWQVLPLLLYNMMLLVQINTEIISKKLLDINVNLLPLQGERGECSHQLSAWCMWLAVTTLSESVWRTISLLKILQQTCSVLSFLCCNVGYHWKTLERNLLQHSGCAYFDDKCSRLFWNVSSFFR